MGRGPRLLPPRVAAACLAPAAALMLWAGTAAAQEFGFAYPRELDSVDPHMQRQGWARGVIANIYEGLVRRGADLTIEPALAVAWSQPEPDTWRFELRRDVVFHDGSPFTADDVVYSFERAASEESAIADLFIGVDQIRKVDDHTVEILTDGINPVLAAQLADWLIMDKEWSEQNLVGKPAISGRDRDDHATRHANGTGPFRLIEHLPATGTVMAPNESWWDRPTHNLAKAVLRPMGSAARRLEALRTGEVQMISPVPAAAVEALRSAECCRVMRQPGLRTLFLAMDQYRARLRSSEAQAENPFKDPRVRQAIRQAIDTAALDDRLGDGALNPAGIIVAPGIAGWRAGLDRPVPPDPAAARRLLAEAGYAEGFSVRLDCPRGLYPGDAVICAAVKDMLGEVGIEVDLALAPPQAHMVKLFRFASDFFLFAWQPPTYDAWNTLFNLVATRAELADGFPVRGQGSFNLSRFSDPEIDALILEAGKTMDPAKRLPLLGRAIELHRDAVGHIALAQPMVVWGVRRDVEIVQRADDRLDLRWVRLR